MNRLIMKALVDWKTSANRKPLILKGARQVGKTWLLKEFGRLHFENVAYINFDNNEYMKNLFDGDYNINRLIEGLQVESNIMIAPEKTLIIFDEIQEVTKALSSLKYFYEKAPEYAIVAAGSLLGVSLHEGLSFPVGKVNFMNLFPMNFYEFLDAINETKLLNLLEKNDWPLIHAFSNKFIECLRKYYVVGGMPEAVYAYAQTNNYKEVRTIQQEILTAYEQDFSKHAPANMVPKIRNVWNSIPVHLSKENKRFTPGEVKKNSRLSEYETALQWLFDAGLIYKIMQITKPEMPLKSYETDFFKVFIHDVGLLNCMAGLDVSLILEKNKLFTEFKGSLTEQYVLQELIASGIYPNYWSSRGRAEIDFIINLRNNIIPIEVKAEENLQSKSLKIYNEKYAPSHCWRISMSNFREESWLVSIPLYAVRKIINAYDKHST